MSHAAQVWVGLHADKRMRMKASGRIRVRGARKRSKVEHVRGQIARIYDIEQNFGKLRHSSMPLAESCISLSFSI